MVLVFMQFLQRLCRLFEHFAAQLLGKKYSEQCTKLFNMNDDQQLRDIKNDGNNIAHDVGLPNTIS